MKQKKYSAVSLINRMHGFTKLIICLLVAIAVHFIVPGTYFSRTHLIISWDAFGFMMILFNWITFFTVSSAEIREQSKEQDESRIIIFGLILVSAFSSLSSVFLLLTNKPTVYQIVIAVTGMLLAWILIHTIFAIRYAHLFYSNNKENKQQHAGGLEFPEDPKPDFLDFAYFAFVVGMTFQVSDVQITSKRLRRICLMHGMISFIFNTFIVALTINVIASLSAK